MLKRNFRSLLLATCLILITIPSALGGLDDDNYQEVYLTKRNFRILLITTCLILITVPSVLGGLDDGNYQEVYRTGNNDQNYINAAIYNVSLRATPADHGLVIIVNSGPRYDIKAPITLMSNVDLSGDETPILYGNGSSVCNSTNQPAYINGVGVSNVVIDNLEFQSTAVATDKFGINDYRNCIQLNNSNNCEIRNCKFTHYLYCDGLRLKNCSAITADWNTIWAGHDGVSILSGSHDCYVKFNNISVFTNTGCRNDGSSNCEVAWNEIAGIPGVRTGWCCLEIEHPCTNLNIHHNILHDFTGSSNSTYGVGGIYSPSGFNIHDNVMWNMLNHSTLNYSNVALGTGNYLDPSIQTIPYWESQGYGLFP